MSRRQIGERAVLALPAVLGTVALLLVARKGVYASPDSAFYVGTARSLLDGDGLTSPPGSPPVSHFPPLFALVLAAVSWLSGLDPLDAAEIVNPFLLGVTAAMVAFVVRRRNGSVALGVGASVTVVVAVDLLVYYASALSEPLFIVLVVGAMISLAAAVESRAGWLWAAAAVLSAAACLTRYVGVALVVAEVMVLLMVGGRRVVARAAGLAASSLGPLALWLALAGRGNRPVAIHLFDTEYWLDGVRAVSRWVLPPYIPWPVIALAAAAAIAALVWAAPAVAATRPRRDDASGPRRLLWRDGVAWRPERAKDAVPTPGGVDVLGRLLPVFAVVYLAVLAVDRAFFDATGRLDLRFLAVLHVLAVIGLLPWAYRVTAGRTRARTAMVAGGLVLVGLHTIYAGSWVAAGLGDTDLGRRGLTAEAWRESQVMAAVEALPPGIPVYSNAPEAVFLLTGRPASPLPAHTDYLSGRTRSEYDAELAVMQARLVEQEGLVVILRPYTFRERFLAPASDLDVEPLQQDEVATLLRPRP